MNKAHCRWLSAAAFLLAVVGFGCGNAPKTFYYTVEIRPPGASSAEAVGSQVGVAVPRAGHLLRQDRIVFFANASQLNYYHYHRWAESPPFMVQSLLMRQLRAAHLFDDIVAYRAQKDLDYVIRGALLAMEEVDTPEQVSARFGLELELVSQHDAHVIWTGRHQCERPVSARTVDMVVATMSQCVQETLDELTRSMGAAVRESAVAAAAEKKRDQ